jgi:uncharacterized protein
MPPAPELIDGLQFARSGTQVRGELAGDRLPRLAQMGCQAERVVFSLAGGIGSTGKPTLWLQASAQLETVCQRCLGPLAMPVSVQAELELCESLLEIARAEDDVDRVLATAAMNVAELVEDELILALPQTPKHEACVFSQGEQDNVAGRSPFGALALLKRARSR